MRLGIRRKLIGTLILVGIFPLVLSLVVILGGGTAMQLSGIRNHYEDVAMDCSNQLRSKLRSEVDNLNFMSELPATAKYLAEQNRLRAERSPVNTAPGSKVPLPDAIAVELDHTWPQLQLTDPIAQKILKNPLSEHLIIRSSTGGDVRQFLVTNAYGELIAADTKSDDFYQADEEWWQVAFNEGKGKIYVSSLVTNPVNGTIVLEIALPIYDRPDVGRKVVGVIKEKFEIGWLKQTLQEFPGRLKAYGQLVDLDTGKTIYAPEPGDVTRRAEIFFQKHRDRRASVAELMFGDLVLGAADVPLEGRLGLGSEQAQLPHWEVLVSKPSSEAMVPLYKLSVTVAAIGVALILVLFILGVAISNREIIMPILRLREATAAVGRGELNVRVMSGDERDPTFRGDELGSLARDFDEMTRQLQRNINALARSNEAKRRFLELAGHELRTPVTYIIGVCQLAQRQLAQDAAEILAGQGNVATARSEVVATAALAKVAAKAQRLSRIIDNLLKLVSNDQFTTRLNKAPVDMRALILQVTSDYRPFVLERKQQLIVDVAENLPSLEADRDKLEDVLINLVSNAVRFSPDGGVISIKARRIMGEMLEIIIQDSGPGIKQEDLTNLFEPFYTGTDILHHHSGELEFGSKGIGLGLAVVRRFVELHGGVVRAQSSPQGTQFQILLPLLREEVMPTRLHETHGDVPPLDSPPPASA